MKGILFQYELEPTTWVYISSLMTIGIYFKFRRFWSLRNLDLIALIVFSPGLVLVYQGVRRQLDVHGRFAQEWLPAVFLEPEQTWEWLEQLGAAQGWGQWLEQFGYIWLFSVGGFFLIRLLLDAIVVRRPLLEPNLSASGLTFTGVALLVFLTSNVLNPNPAPRLEHALAEQQSRVSPAPGGVLFRATIGLADTAADSARQQTPEQRRNQWIRETASQGAAILGHLAVVIGIVLVGYRHFDNIQTGAAAAALYLMLPYTAQITARLDHVIPAALLVWAVQSYRRPAVAGILIGLAAGVIFYPLFLLPLWCGFYWRRGLYRFLSGVCGALLTVGISLACTPGGLESLAGQLKQMFSWSSSLPGDLAGFWNPAYHEPVFRIPVIAAFMALAGGLALWPAQKNLGTLLSCSAAVMLGVQFWHPYWGGVCMGWYLPLLLLTVFRPNLEDRVAVVALSEGWLRGRRTAGAAKE
jgi:hypothetical protein